MSSTTVSEKSATLFGHPAGLFTLFFAEMWERFSFYGMRALLVLYMVKGFLGYGDTDATAVYGAYTALVYMMPFFGGMLADRLLGARRAVIFGAILMVAGQGLLMAQHGVAFFSGLALLICGNGFFKPNISTIVGALYPKGSTKRDGGFTIFYMGINLGAALSPLLCGYVGETYGWHWGFGLATIGMTIGLIVFANWLPPGDAGGPPDRNRLRHRPVLVTQLSILVGVLLAEIGLAAFYPDNVFSIAVNVFVGVSLLAAGIIACWALRGSAGGLITTEWAIYGGTIVLVPLVVLLVSGFAPLTKKNQPVTVFPEKTIKRLNEASVMTAQLRELQKAVKSESRQTVAELAKSVARLNEQGDLGDERYEAILEAIALAKAGQWDVAQARIGELEHRFPPERAKAVLAVVLREASRPAGLVFVVAGLLAFGYVLIETFRLDTIPRQRMYVVLILTLFSMPFWACYEQAGSSLNNFTDRNVDRVSEDRRITPEEVGKTIQLQPTQEQLGYRNGEQLFTLDILAKLRQSHEKDTNFAIDWKVTEDDVGMGIARRVDEIPASTLQAVNPIYILIFGLVFTALWGFLANRGLEPSTPVKFALGLLQLALGFVVFWYSAQMANERGMVWIGWLFLGYLLHTTGELCLSPVGLSMITKLSPGYLVSTVMGTWFLATAFSQFLAAIIAQFTSVTQGGNGEGVVIPVPSETVHVYGDVFGKIAIFAFGSALICFALAPLLTRWMHAGVEEHAG